jgi:hypothetical protein
VRVLPHAPPSPSRASGVGPSLSRDAGEGLLLLPIDHAALAQRLDLRLAVAELVAQDGGGVLAEARRRGDRALRRSGKLDWPAGDAHRADRCVVGLDHHFAGDGMRMGERRGDAEHRRVRHVGGGEPLFPFGDGARLGDIRDQPVERVAMVAPQGRRREARIGREIGPLQRLAQFAPEALRQHRDGSSPVMKESWAK